MAAANRPWGVVLNGLGQTNTFQNRFEFLNREKESTFGLNTIRLGARGYNPTIGRFDRTDPVTAEQEHLSLYQYGWNNPVNLSDPDGRCPLCGFIIGASVDYAFQVAGNMANGKSFTESLTYDINLKSIGISAVAGLATSGLSAIGGKGTQFAITTAIDAAESVAKQATSGNGSVTLTQTVSDVASNKVAGFMTKKAENIIDTKVLVKEADRTARVSANDPSSSGRAARSESAQSNLNKSERVNTIVGQTTSGVVGNTIQNTSNVVRTPIGSSSYSPPAGVIKPDATNLQRPIIVIRPN